MGMLKIKKTTRNPERLQALIKEVRKEDKKALYARIDESKYYKLIDILHKERIEYAQWLTVQVENYIKKKADI